MSCSWNRAHNERKLHIFHMASHWEWIYFDCCLICLTCGMIWSSQSYFWFDLWKSAEPNLISHTSYCMRDIAHIKPFHFFMKPHKKVWQIWCALASQYGDLRINIKDLIKTSNKIRSNWHKTLHACGASSPGLEAIYIRFIKIKHI